MKNTTRLLNAFSNGWRAVVGFVVWLFGIWPFIFLVLSLIYGIKWRRHYVKNANK